MRLFDETMYNVEFALGVTLFAVGFLKLFKVVVAKSPLPNAAAEAVAI